MALVFVRFDEGPNGVSLDRGAPYFEVSTERGTVTVTVETRAGQSIGDVAVELERELVDIGHDVRVIDGNTVVVLQRAEAHGHIRNDVTDDGLQVTSGFALRP